MDRIDEYVRLARSWGELMEEGDSDLANALYERVERQFQQITQANQEKQLFDRAESTNDAACFFIASHLGKRDPFRARKLYERLVHSSKPFIAMSAEHILRELNSPGR
jgi:hypothetical protein